MRSLVILFIFFVLILGIGITSLFGELPAVDPDNGSSVALGQVYAAGSSNSSTNGLEVDRDDDPDEVYPCTDEPNDCTLRSAITKAKESGNPTTITFVGHRWIRLTRALPSLSEANTTIKASNGQEVHIDGNNVPGNVFRITASHVSLEGLRIYGAGSGFSNIVITESASGVIIANNIIGDGDGPSGNCGSSELSYAGIYVDARGETADAARAWIFGNIIECHNGNPGEGIVVLTDMVYIGQDNHGRSGEGLRNIIQYNRGFGINLNDSTGNTISHNELSGNQAGSIYAGSLHNNLMFNDFK